MRSLPLFGALCALSGALTSPVSAEPTARVSCEITENGQMATGVVSILKGSEEIASGSCGRDLPVPQGEYTASLRLDGAFDGPEQRQPVSAKPGAVIKLKADFTTATLQVDITGSGGRRAAGMAIIKRNGQQLGTLGSGVAAHLSTGTYRIFVRYRAQEKDLGDVKLAVGKTVTLQATFE